MHPNVSLRQATGRRWRVKCVPSPCFRLVRRDWCWRSVTAGWTWFRPCWLKGPMSTSRTTRAPRRWCAPANTDTSRSSSCCWLNPAVTLRWVTAWVTHEGAGIHAALLSYKICQSANWRQHNWTLVLQLFQSLFMGVFYFYEEFARSFHFNYFHSSCRILRMWLFFFF